MKNLLLVIKVFVVFVAIVIGLYFIAKARVKVKLNSKLELVKAEWDSLAYLQNLNQLYVCQLIRSNPGSEKSNDSIGFLFKKCQSTTTNSNCNDSVITIQYRFNESFLALKRQLSDSSFIRSSTSDSLLNLIEINTLNLYESLKEYNRVVKEFNLFYSTFPVFLIAKSIGLKRQAHFELTYGKPNMDPIVKKNEIPDWQRKIDEEHGFVD